MRPRGHPSLNIERGEEFLRILLLMAQGVRTPKALSEALGLKPSTLMKYLNLLRRNGLIRYGEKLGKNQPYEIVWEALSHMFVKRATALSAISLAVHLRDLSFSKKTPEERDRIWREVQSRREMDLQAFASRPEIVGLVRAGTMALASSIDDVTTLNTSLTDFLDSFRRVVIRARHALTLEGKNEDLKSLFKLTLMVDHITPEEYSWLKALKDLGLIDEQKFLKPLE
jgi:DNA-binding transcriptional ArsR family regulator